MKQIIKELRHTLLKPFSMLTVGLMMTLAVNAQTPKIKTDGDKESKYKSENLKTKDKKDESKMKADDLKVKDKKDKVKVKGRVKPMHVTATERTELRTGETQVRTKEHMEQINVEQPAPEPIVSEPMPLPEPATAVHKPVMHKRTAPVHRHVVARKATTAPRYIVRTKVVKDTVYVPSPPERVVSTEYVHDTVTLTRVDTVIKMQRQNTYTGYRVPRGDFKKVKLKRDKDDEVWMKRKDKDGKLKDEKLR